MSIGFVVVTYNSSGVLGACLASVPKGHDIVVVDNASTDGSVAIAQSFNAHVIRNAKNVGFGTACNEGAKALTTSHVFFLNPDAVLTEGALAEIEKAIVRFPDAGGFGPSILTAGRPSPFRKVSFIQDQGRRTVPEASIPSDYTEVDFIDGASLICDRKLFLDIEGFDESLFLYFEDDDLCFRIRSKNKCLIYVPFAVVNHQKKSSSGSSLRLHYIRTWHETRSRQILSQKYALQFNAKKEKRRAVIRLVRSIVTLSPTKAIRYYGVMRALFAPPR